MNRRGETVEDTMNVREKSESCPKISIVTPCFNSEKYLEATINSVLEQRYPNLEYGIVDGGSTDGTIGIIRKYESELAWWVSEQDGGIYDALQKGFAKTSGEVMSWIGSDDMYHPKALWTVAELFSSFQDIQWLVGAATTYDEFGRTINTHSSRRFLRYDFLDGDYQWLQQESCFWRRPLWEAAGSRLDTSLRYAGDFELWIRFFRHETLHVTDALIGGFRSRSKDQMSLEGHGAYLEEAANIIKAEKLTKDELHRFYEFRQFKRFLRMLDKMKIFNVERILRKYIHTKFGNVKLIRFDRFKQRFEYY
jgi:glycosyltransferase involved in cell wall biosynthesis